MEKQITTILSAVKEICSMHCDGGAGICSQQCPFWNKEKLFSTESHCSLAGTPAMWAIPEDNK